MEFTPAKLNLFTFFKLPSAFWSGVRVKSISPEELFLEGHATELNAYKGVMISKENADKDMFKINLLDLLNK